MLNFVSLSSPSGFLVCTYVRFKWLDSVSWLLDTPVFYFHSFSLCVSFWIIFIDILSSSQILNTFYSSDNPIEGIVCQWCNGYISSIFIWLFSMVFFFFNYVWPILLLLLFFFNYTILGVLYLFINGCVGSSFLCEGFLLLWSTGSRRAGSVVVAHGPICSVACGIFPDQGSKPCLLHWQAASQPLRHQGSP